MKITIELPDEVFRQAETCAAKRGVTLQRLVIEALLAQLPRRVTEFRASDAEPPWMAGFGGLSDLGDDHERIRQAIENEFEGLTPEKHA